MVSQIILKECVAVYNKIPQSGFLTSLHRTIWRAIKVQGVLETLTPPQTVCVWLVFYIVSIPNLFPLNFGIRKEVSYIHGKGKEEAPSFEELQSDYQHFEWRVIGHEEADLSNINLLS